MLARIAKALAVTAEGNKPGVGPEKTPRSSGTDPRPDSSVGRMKQAPRPKTARRDRLAEHANVQPGAGVYNF